MFADWTQNKGWSGGRDYRVEPGNDMGGGNIKRSCRRCFAERIAVMQLASALGRGMTALRTRGFF